MTVTRSGRPLRVMAVLPSLWPGGAEMQLVHLLLGLPRDEYECELVTLLSVPGGNGLSARLEAGGVPWTDLGVAPALDRPMGAGHAARNLLIARRRLARRIEAFGPDVVYSRLWYAGVAVGSLNRRALGFRHVANEELTLDAQIDRGRVKRWLRGWVIRQADRWVVPTEGLRVQFVRAGAPADQGQVIHNATPLPPLRREASGPAGAGPLRVAAMGRLVPDKGFDRLLDVAAELRRRGVPVQVEVAGEGPERAALEGRARALGVADTVRFIGYVPDPLAFLQAHDVFVLTSRAEGFANVLVEAMACGLPAVSFDIEFGPRELVVHGETGYLVPDGETGGMAAHLHALAADPALRARLGHAGRERAATQFSIDRMTARFAALFRDVTRPPARAGGEHHVWNSWHRSRP